MDWWWVASVAPHSGVPEADPACSACAELQSQSLEGAGVDQQQGDDSGQQQQQPTGPPPAYDHQPSTSATSGLYNLAGNYLRQYGPAAVAAGTALLHPMNGRQPSVRAANTSSTRTDQQRSLGLGHSSSEPIVPIANVGSTTSLRTRDEARRRRAELEAELAAIHSDTTSSSSFADSSPPPSAHSTRSASSAAAPPNQYAATTRIYHPSAAGSSTAHPRSASAGHPASLTPGSGLGLGGKRAPSPSSQLGASGLGFEEIGRDELGDYARVGAGERSTAAAGGGGWWKWGAGQPGAAAAGGVGEERKNA